MIDDSVGGGSAMPSERSRGLWRRTAALAMMLACFGPGAWASDRFEVVDGDLLDQTTGLLWQQTSATTLGAFPADSSLANGWRIPTTNEVLNLFSDVDFGTETTISQASDAFTALSFFANSPSTAPFCSSLPAGSTCISAFAADVPGPWQPGYDAVIYGYRIGKKGSVTVDSTATLGDYTRDLCGSFCGQQSYFTVQAVPEPAGWALASLGMALTFVGAGIRRRKSLSQAHKEGDVADV